MLRTSATRSLLKSFASSRAPYSFGSGSLRKASTSSLSPKRPQILSSLPHRVPSFYYATKTSSETPYDKIDLKAEETTANSKIVPHPEEVSGESSVRHVFEESPAPTESHGSVKDDLQTIKETFALNDVPKESLYIGAAGVIPYAATSASTVWLAYDINHAHAHGQGILFSPETAHQLLDIITPVQVGYGAVIISFLGAIHWGLEYAGYGGYHSYRRYVYGVIAPAVAWPTILMPVEYALITQFTAFTFLYFADARATVITTDECLSGGFGSV
ncbi:mitochondrial inner membrane 1 protein [Rutstroemia sp. NJR-2017a BBW]|nr:mitochondrial inner membrane 1 protein [Rutstroemia sp. NJR-2017a BBW]